MISVFVKQILVSHKQRFSISPGTHDPCCMNNFMWNKKRKMVIMMCGQNNGHLTTFSDHDEQRSPLVLTKAKMDRHGSSTVMDIPSLSGKTLVEKEEEVAAAAKDLCYEEEIGIVKFLRGKVLLVTGSTGFLAKVFIEKILRTVPDVSKIYILIKAKNKEAAMERVKSEIINTKLFKCLQQMHGKSFQTFLFSKLEPVIGNVSKANLGIEAGVADQIINQIDVIVHSAGNTTFDERYDVALDTNTKGPHRLMQFAKRCWNLKLVLHVSTAYANGERQGIIMEKPFCIGDSIEREKAASECPKRSFPLLDIESEIKMAMDARDASQDIIVAQKMKEMGLERARMYGWQDAYVFTKAMGEMMIERTRGHIPVVIIRPSVIESTYRDPIPGWIEGIRVLDPLFLFYGKGELTAFPANPKGVIDIVPADMVVNAMLAAIAKHGSIDRSASMDIYHVASSIANPIMFEDLFKYCFEYFNSCPYLDSKRQPIHVDSMKLYHSLDDFHSHILTEALQQSSYQDHAHCGPSSSSSFNSTSPLSSQVGSGKISRRVQKLMDMVKHLASMYQPYTFYGGRFDNTNTRKLMVQLSKEESGSFGFDVGSIDWRDYIRNVHIPGLLKNVLKGRGM